MCPWSRSQETPKTTCPGHQGALSLNCPREGEGSVRPQKGKAGRFPPSGHQSTPLVHTVADGHQQAGCRMLAFMDICVYVFKAWTLTFTAVVGLREAGLPGQTSHRLPLPPLRFNKCIIVHVLPRASFPLSPLDPDPPGKSSAGSSSLALTNQLPSGSKMKRKITIWLHGLDGQGIPDSGAGPSPSRLAGLPLPGSGPCAGNARRRRHGLSPPARCTLTYHRGSIGQVAPPAPHPRPRGWEGGQLPQVAPAGETLSVGPCTGQTHLPDDGFPAAKSNYRVWEPGASSKITEL